MRFYFVFSLTFQKLTFFPHTSILTKNVFLVNLKAKYQNVPIISEFCHMSWVTGSLLANLIRKSFGAFIMKHPVVVGSGLKGSPSLDIRAGPTVSRQINSELQQYFTSFFSASMAFKVKA